MKQNRLRALCEGAILIALSLILGLIKLFELPLGGSISLEMLPLFLYCLRWGAGPGFLACTTFGILQVFVQGAVSYGWASILLDYVVAFAFIGLCGFARGRSGGLWWGPVLGALGRFAVHFVSGITIYKILAPTKLFGTVFDNPVLYSIAYNGSYVAIDLILCLIIIAILQHTALKQWLVPAK